MWKSNSKSCVRSFCCTFCPRVVLINICDGCGSGCKRVVRAPHAHTIFAPGLIDSTPLGWLPQKNLCSASQLFPYFRDFRETYFDVFNPFLPVKWINSWMWQGTHSSAPDLHSQNHTQPNRNLLKNVKFFLDAIVSPSTYPCHCQLVGQLVSEWFIVLDLEIAIESPSFASLFSSFLCLILQMLSTCWYWSDRR